MFDFSKTKIRCSAIYSIMGGSDRKTNLQKWEEMCEEVAKQQLRRENMKKKDGPGYAKVIEAIERLQNCITAFESVKNEPLPLSEGCKTFLSSVYGKEKYGKWSPSRDLGNKFTAKGKQAENTSIDLVSKLDGKMYYKNELVIENDWLKGTPDVIVGEDPYNAEMILDVKTPWDCEGFFSTLNADLIPDYLFQMQGYMAISNAQVAEVHFCLVDIPDYMLQQERERLFRRMEVVTELSPDFVREEARLVNNLTFGDIPMEERRIKFTVPRDEEIIQKIYRQVEKCRPYLQELEKKHLFGVDSVLLEQINQEPEGENT